MSPIRFQCFTLTYTYTYNCKYNVRLCHILHYVYECCSKLRHACHFPQHYICNVDCTRERKSQDFLHSFTITRRLGISVKTHIHYICL